jgi:hypothetical protein
LTAAEDVTVPREVIMPKWFSDKDVLRFMDGGLRDPIGDAIEYAKDAGLSPEESARHILDAIERQYRAEDQPNPFSDPYMDLDDIYMDRDDIYMDRGDIYMDRGDIYMDPSEVGPWLGKNRQVDSYDKRGKGIGNLNPTRLSDEGILGRFLKFPQELHKATELWRRDLDYAQERYSPVIPLPSAETKEVLGGWPEEPKKRPSWMTISSSDPKWPGPRGWTPDPLRKGYFHFNIENVPRSFLTRHRPPSNDVSRPKPPTKTKNKMPIKMKNDVSRPKPLAKTKNKIPKGSQMPAKKVR